MKKIIFIQRNAKAGYSIKKVFSPIISSIENKEVYEVPNADASIISLIKNLKFIFSKRKKGCIYHVTGDIHYGILALLGKKTVLTIHDTVGLDFNSEKNHLKYLLKKWLWFTLPIKLASKVVCISNATKDYVQKYTKRKDIEVIHNCVDPNLIFKPNISNHIPFKFLIIGTKKNKNIERIFEALDSLPCQIIIIGRLSKEQIQFINKLNVNYITKSNLSDEELNQEYYSSDCVLFCSLFEGFGMPIIESNKAGTPIICSNLPVLKEIGGNSTIYVDPYDINSIRQCCFEIIKNKNLRELLVNNGIKNVQNFEKEIILKKWINLYKALS